MAEKRSAADQRRTASFPSQIESFVAHLHVLLIKKTNLFFFFFFSCLLEYWCLLSSPYSSLVGLRPIGPMAIFFPGSETKHSSDSTLLLLVPQLSFLQSEFAMKTFFFILFLLLPQGPWSCVSVTQFTVFCSCQHQYQLFKMSMLNNTSPAMLSTVTILLLSLTCLGCHATLMLLIFYWTTDHNFESMGSF